MAIENAPLLSNVPEAFFVQTQGADKFVVVSTV
jgi:hypothetical protein